MKKIEMSSAVLQREWCAQNQDNEVFQEESTVSSAVGRWRLRIAFGNRNITNNFEKLFP